MRKTPSVSYYAHKIAITPKSKIIDELKNAPLSKIEFDFMVDVINRFNYKDLAEKYHKTQATIYVWKRKLFERLHRFDLAQLR